MQRIKELAADCLTGRVSQKGFRSAMIAQLSMLSDADTFKLAEVLLREKCEAKEDV